MATYEIEKFELPNGDICNLKDNVSGYTTNTGTVTSVGVSNASGESDFTISGSPVTTAGTITIEHANSTTAKSTQAVYPITFDKHGHITGSGSAVTVPTASDTYSSTSSDVMTGKGVNAALQTLDSSISATTGQAISAITITDGKISASSKIAVGDANQNAFSNVKVDTTTIAADTATDTLELVAGTDITLTPDATNDKVTIAFSNASGYTKNTGTVTSVGLSNASGESDFTIGGSPITGSGTLTIEHANSVTAQTTQALYPIKFDKHGHITGSGSAVTVPTNVSQLTNDSGFLTSSTGVTSVNNQHGAVTVVEGNGTLIGSTNSNDADYVTPAQVVTALEAHKQVFVKHTVSNSGFFGAVVTFDDFNLIAISGTNKTAVTQASIINADVDGYFMCELRGDASGWHENIHQIATESLVLVTLSDISQDFTTATSSLSAIEIYLQALAGRLPMVMANDAAIAHLTGFFNDNGDLRAEFSYVNCNSVMALLGIGSSISISIDNSRNAYISMKNILTSNDIATSISSSSTNNKAAGALAVYNAIPTATSDLTNDSGFLTPSTGVTTFNGSSGAITYTAPVTSVNTQTGAVVLDADDVGALPDTTTYAASPTVGGSATFTNGVHYAQVDSTSTSTAFTAQIPGITSYYDGLTVILYNGKVTSASGYTININGLGAYGTYSNMALGNPVTPTDPTRDTTIFNINYAMIFVYCSNIGNRNVTGWICYRGYDANTNTIGYQLRTNSYILNASDAFRYYKILFTSADGTKWVPASANTTNSATSAKVVNQRPINPFGEIVYCGNTTSYTAGAALTATAIWQQYTLTLGYSFNRTGAALTLTTKKPVYVKCAPQSDGSAIIDADVPYVQDLPSTEDGKIYILLGMAYSATAIELLMNHPVYYYKNGAIRLWTNAVNVPTKTSDLTNDSGFITSSQAPVQSVNGSTGEVTISVPTKTSDLTNDSGFVTSDTKVTQTVTSITDYTYWRGLCVGSSSSQAETGTLSTTTDQVRIFSNIRVQPSSGTIKATTFNGQLSGTIASSTTATTQASTDNSTKVATTAFVKSVLPVGLPSVSSSDNGKVLMVVNGAWAAVSLPVYDGRVV